MPIFFAIFENKWSTNEERKNRDGKELESKQSLIHMLTPFRFIHFNININQPEKSDDIVEHLQ